MGNSNCLNTHIPQNIFCIQQKKETHTGLEQLVNDDRIKILGELSL